MPTKIARIYDHAPVKGEYRILIDRLWPRGISKAEAKLDYWAKEVAPSSDLRRWFDHRPDRFDQFADRYIEELKHNPAVAGLVELMQAHPNNVLLYGAKDPMINQAVVLQQFLQQHHT